MYEQPSKKPLVFALVGCLLLLFGWYTFNYANRYGKTKVTVSAIPSDSTVKMNGAQIQNGSYYLKPGHYTFEASRQDFGTVTKSIDIHTHSTQQTVYLLPTPDTAAAIEYLNQHPEIQQQREKVGGINSQINQQSLSQKYPIINRLPAYTSHYRIDYALDGQQNISFSVTLYAILNNPDQYQQYVQQLQAYKAEALQFLSDNGINTSKAPVTYTPNV